MSAPARDRKAPGAALVHCAAGKDRTGTLVALALSVADADRQAIIDDYAASSERVEGVIARLMASTTYAENLEGRPMSSHRSHPETMISFLRHIDDTFGGVLPMLIKIGWTAEDTDQLRAKLRLVAIALDGRPQNSPLLRSRNRQASSYAPGLGSCSRRSGPPFIVRAKARTSLYAVDCRRGSAATRLDSCRSWRPLLRGRSLADCMCVGSRNQRFSSIDRVRLRQARAASEPVAGRSPRAARSWPGFAPHSVPWDVPGKTHPPSAGRRAAIAGPSPRLISCTSVPSPSCCAMFFTSQSGCRPVADGTGSSLHSLRATGPFPPRQWDNHTFRER